MAQVRFQFPDYVTEIEIAEGANLLLEAASRSVPVPFRCTTGRCCTCLVKVIQGEENLSDYSEQELYRLDDQSLASGCRLACQTYVFGDVTIEVQEEDTDKK